MSTARERKQGIVKITALALCLLLIEACSKRQPSQAPNTTTPTDVGYTTEDGSTLDSQMQSMDPYDPYNPDVQSQELPQIPGYQTSSSYGSPSSAGYRGSQSSDMYGSGLRTMDYMQSCLALVIGPDSPIRMWSDSHRMHQAGRMALIRCYRQMLRQVQELSAGDTGGMLDNNLAVLLAFLSGAMGGVSLQQ